MSHVVTYLFFFILSFNVFATTLGPIDVIAKKNSENYSFSSVTSLSEAELSGTSTQLVSTLSNIPGIMSVQNGGPGGSTSYFIRGAESRHVGFSLDGLKLNDPSSTTRQFDAAFFTTPLLEEVDIHKGPQSVLYGADAMGGHIDLRTRKGSNKKESKLYLRGGSFGTVSTALRSDWGDKKNKGTLSWLSFRTDGISRLNKKRFNATERDSSSNTQLTSSSTHKVSEKVDTDILLSFVKSDSELDGTTTDNSYDRTQNFQYMLQQTTNLSIKKTSAISVRNGFNRHNRFFKTLSSGNDSFIGESFQNEALFKNHWSNIETISAVIYEHESFKQDHLNKSFDLGSAFFQSLINDNNFQHQFGVRGDHHSRYGYFKVMSLGSKYKMDQHQFSIQYSEGYKAPSLYQLYGPYSNDQLRPELNKSIDGRWLWKDLEISVYRNDLRNMILYVNNHGYKNQGKYIIEGEEIILNLNFDRLRVSPSFTHLEFKNANTEVLRRPNNMAQLYVLYCPSDYLELGLKPKWFSSKKDVDENFNMVKLSSYETVDGDIKFKWSEQEIGIEVINLFDRNYEELYGYSVMPRSYFVNYTKTFY